jgi:tetratricopeptide (TPR) repeat protein
VSLDRNATLRNAEKLLGQGQLAEAIEEYVRLADDLYAEGFIPKASALYKKTLKIKADHEHALVRLVDIAESQGLMVDAKAYLRELSKHRHQREDVVGVAQCLVRVARWPNGEAEARRIRETLGIREAEQPAPVPEEIHVESAASEQALEAPPLDEPEVEAATPQADEPPPMPVAPEPDAAAKPLETVFGEMRSRTARDRRALLYDLADTLERRGDFGRALEIFMEVQSDGDAYRDVAERIERLRVLQQGSPRA